jgi:hypothetical protein
MIIAGHTGVLTMHTLKRKVLRFSPEKQNYSDDEIIKEEPLL